ncbi:AzlC family ABC transporter permease [Phyllobacterium phragmitis]|uniref:AzlC family ABC transporter permease n=2 Tax=Phyllobacterium phragmitis TaxID=2670329 RepID=A0ABQ0GZL6_9HYPH
MAMRWSTAGFMPHDQPLQARPETGSHDFTTHLRWFLRGASRIFSVPAVLLMSSFVGFAGLAIESGMTLVQTAFMTVMIWALPAKVVLIGAATSGATLPAAALSVALSSVRLMPMVVSLLPELRGPRTRRITLLFLSHFVAVTAWVMAMEELHTIPRHLRTSYFAGVGMVLVGTNALVVVAVYLLSASFPPIVFAALFMLTPMYFLTSLWRSARERAGQVAMIAGLVLFPVFHGLAPGYDLLLSGVVGGACAFLFHHIDRKRLEAK